MIYRRVEMADGSVKYVPVPADPLAALRDAADDEVREACIAELQAQAIEEARCQALCEEYQAEQWRES